MAENEPQLKKVKTNSGNDDDDIFVSFHKNNLRNFQLALQLINHEQSSYAVGIAKIKVCNAKCSKSFSKATCDCEVLSTPYASDGSTSVPEGFSLSSFFQYGFDILESYLESSDCMPSWTNCMPREKGAKIALKKLLTVLSEKESVEKALAAEDLSETEWTERVAQHLLSKLAVWPNYTLDDQNERKSDDLKCTCGCGEKLFGSYGDTSLGVPSYWHGRVDILMDAAITTFFSEEPDSPDTEYTPSIETQSATDRMAANKEQILAKTIVFSFLRKKNHPELDHFLIPTIAMSKTQIAICFYDSENDVLLLTPRFDLFLEGRFLKVATVITLWLALNFRYFCTGVPDEIIEMDYKADLFKHLGSCLENYSEDVKCPCDYQTTNRWLVCPYFKRVKRIKDNINQISGYQNDS